MEHAMKNVKIYLILIFCMHALHGDKMTVVNLTSLQATINFDTKLKNYSLSVNPSENLYIQENNLDNQVNQYDNPAPVIEYNHSQIKKIIIQRMQSDMPQIIYYNNEVTSDGRGNSTGLYGTFASRGGFIQIYQDSVSINNLLYKINDMSSFIVKIQKLNDLLSIEMEDAIQKEIDNLLQSVKLIELSEKASDFSFQTTMITSEINQIIDQISIMHKFKDFDIQLNDLSKNLTFDTINSTQVTLNNMQTALSTLDQTNTKNKKNADDIKIKMIKLKKQIMAMQKELQLKNNPMLIEQMN